MIEQGRVGRGVDLVFQLGEVLGELVAFGAQLGPAFVDVPDEVLVDVIGKFEAADQALALGLVVADGSAHRGDPVGAFALGGLVQDFQVGVQELVSYWPKTWVARKLSPRR